MIETRLQDLARKDLNQLVSLAALLSEGGVTRAAEKLNVAQPTMSKALTRLRRTFDDPLLVREGNAMHLTPFASELSLKLQGVMKSIDALFHSPGPFDPSTVRGWLKIAANDYVQSTLALPFIQHMRETAPNLRIELRNVGSLYPEQILEEGIVDIVISAAFPFSSLHRHQTFSDPFVCVADVHNTDIGQRLALDEFLELEHVDITPSGTGLLRRFFEKTQRRFKEERNIVMVLSSFASLPEILKGSPAVALMPSRMFEKLSATSLRRIDIDFELPAYDVSLWWHPRTHMEPMMRWARSELIDFST
ncbi:MAG: LysR family transcriptional regulator [Rhizobiaceae bacterium]